MSRCSCRAQASQPSTQITQTEDNTVALLESLSEFVAASSKLVSNLQHTIEINKSTRSVTSGTNTTGCLANCAGLEPKLATGCLVTCGGLSPKPSKVEQKTEMDHQLTQRQAHVQADLKLDAKPSKCDQACRAPDHKEKKEDNKHETPEKPDSDKRQETPSELALSCKEPKCPANLKAQKTAKKQAREKFMKEKAEKMKMLKESVWIVQNNMKGVSEQIIQLEKFCEENDPVHLVDGQINPATLYKEIMKPQTPPTFNASKVPMQPLPAPAQFAGNCTSQSSSNVPLYSANSTSSSFFDPARTSTKEKISILSTSPYY